MKRKIFQPFIERLQRIRFECGMTGNGYMDRKAALRDLAQIMPRMRSDFSRRVVVGEEADTLSQLVPPF